LEYDTIPNALAVIEKIPPGCTFKRLEYVDGVLLLGPAPGMERTLEFLWDTLRNLAPESPVRLTYVLSVADGEVGNEEFRGAASIAADKIRTVKMVDASRFKIVEILEVAVGAIRVTWSCCPGACYTVWSCTDLAAGAWIEEATIVSGGETTAWTDLDRTSPYKFYRIELK